MSLDVGFQSAALEVHLVAVVGSAFMEPMASPGSCVRIVRECLF